MILVNGLQRGGRTVIKRERIPFLPRYHEDVGQSRKGACSKAGSGTSGVIGFMHWYMHPRCSGQSALYTGVVTNHTHVSWFGYTNSVVFACQLGLTY